MLFSEWLPTANRVEIERALDALIAAPSTHETGDAQRECYAELARRDTAANATRAEFFPRMTFRDVQDAELIGELVRSYALGMMEQMRQAIGIIKAAKEFNAVGIGTSFYDASGKAVNADDTIADFRSRLLRVADLTACVIAEMHRLRTENGEPIVPEDTEYASEFIRIVANMNDLLEGN